MTLTTFIAGTKAKATPINDNFSEVELGYQVAENISTRDIDNTIHAASTTSASWQDVVMLATPTSVKDGQKILIECFISGKELPTGFSEPVRIYDDTDATELILTDFDINNILNRYMVAIVTIASSGNTKDIKLQQRGDGNNDQVQIYGHYLKCSFYND